MWLEHNASPAQAGLGASGPQTEKLGSQRPPDGFVVSHFVLVAPLRLVGGPRRGSFSILNLFLLHSLSPLLPLLFFQSSLYPHFHSFLSPAVSFFLFFFWAANQSLCVTKQKQGKKFRKRGKKSAQILATHLDPSMSLSLSSFFILSIHFFLYVFILQHSLPKNVQNFFLSSLAASKDQKVHTFYQAEPRCMRWHLRYLFSQHLYQHRWSVHSQQPEI